MISVIDRARMTAALAGLSVLLVPGCGRESLDKPLPPEDMSALLAAYEMPTGALDEGTLDGVGDVIEESVRAIDELAAALARLVEIIWKAVDTTLDEGGDGMAAAALAADRDRQLRAITGEGYLRISHTCHGWQPDAPVDPEQNGSAALTLTFSQEGVDPVIWGAVTRCRYIIDDRLVQIDGGVSLYLGDTLQFASMGTSPILFRLDVRLEVDGAERVDGGFDFRVCPAESPSCIRGNHEFRVWLPDDTFVVLFVNLDRATGGVRDRNGTWTCAFAEGRCQRDRDGGEIDIPVMSF